MIRDGGECVRCKMNNKGQLGIYEALIFIVLIASVAGIGYLYIHKPTDTSIYQADSKPKITEFTVHCSPFSCCSDKVDEFMEGKKNAVTNSVK
jgi:hypothetical protein